MRWPWRGRPAGSSGETASGNYWLFCSTLPLPGLKHRSYSGLASGISGSSGRFGGPLSVQNRAKVDIAKAFSPALIHSLSHPWGFCSVQLRSNHLARRAVGGTDPSCLWKPTINRVLPECTQLDTWCPWRVSPGNVAWLVLSRAAHYGGRDKAQTQKRPRKIQKEVFLATFLRRFILPPDILNVPYCSARWLISKPGLGATTLSPFLGPTEPRPPRYHSVYLIFLNLRNYRASHFLHESNFLDSNPDPCAPCVTSTSILVWMVPVPMPASAEIIHRRS